jgi:hypothetical protein
MPQGEGTDEIAAGERERAGVGGCTGVRDRHSGRDRQSARSPQRPAAPLLGGDIDGAPGRSLGMKVRWLWGGARSRAV